MVLEQMPIVFGNYFFWSEPAAMQGLLPTLGFIRWANQIKFGVSKFGINNAKLPLINKRLLPYIKSIYYPVLN